jgi:formylmethanofuran dehydrogenase subunit A
VAIENDNRVLSRRNARVIAAEEMICVSGGVVPHTNTACTFDIRITLAGGNGGDGDLNEC